jgi:hypothetical protein
MAPNLLDDETQDSTVEAGPPDRPRPECSRATAAGRRAIHLLRQLVLIVAPGLILLTVERILHSPHRGWILLGLGLGFAAGVTAGAVAVRHRTRHTRELLDWVGEDLAIKRTVIARQAIDLQRLTGEHHP